MGEKIKGTDYKSAPAGLVIGKLKTLSLDKLKINLVIVPVNRSAGFSATDFTNALNDIYQQSVVEWNVTVEDVYNIEQDDWDKDEDEKMNDGESTLLSNYSDEQIKFKRQYKSDRDMDNDAYYVFVMSDIPSKTGLAGYMPLKGQYAFIHSATVTNAAQLIAHELGHGAFRLWHTFSSESDYYMAEKSSENLMDYNEGEELHKYQWDKIHNPVGGFYMFQDEEEGAMVDNDIIKKLIAGIRDATVEEKTTISLNDYYTTTYSYGTNVPDWKTVDYGEDNKFDVALNLNNVLDESEKNIVKISTYSVAENNRKYSTDKISIDGLCLTVKFDYKNRSGCGIELAVPINQKQKFKDYLFAALIEQFSDAADTAMNCAFSAMGSGMACNIGVRAAVYFYKNDPVLFPIIKSGLFDFNQPPYIQGKISGEGRANDIYDDLNKNDLTKFESIPNASGCNYPDFEELQKEANNGIAIIGVKKVEGSAGHIVLIMPELINEGGDPEDFDIGTKLVSYPICLECGVGNKAIEPFRDDDDIADYKWYKYKN